MQLRSMPGFVSVLTASAQGRDSLLSKPGPRTGVSREIERMFILNLKPKLMRRLAYPAGERCHSLVQGHPRIPSRALGRPLGVYVVRLPI